MSRVSCEPFFNPAQEYPTLMVAPGAGLSAVQDPTMYLPSDARDEHPPTPAWAAGADPMSAVAPIAVAAATAAILLFRLFMMCPSPEANA
ncbi:hypothetical protein AC792_00275 [Arthrobacter sp. RIT-PI-e]|nr:hypothetical protein AC792_00275 [Arthrobacter sp. RIT-PI-e]